jgi:predicted DNA-binding transcriptional regulator YafY
MRADRLLTIVLLLQTNHQLTSKDLASRLEVSERTIHRDMEALSGAGIPVVALRGMGGGWSLLGEYRTNLTGLNEAEIETLFVTKSPKVLADLKLEKAAEGAMLKLLAALPTSYQRAAERARRRIYVDVQGWKRQEEAVPLLPVLQEAIWLERRLAFTYSRGDKCDAVDRTVDPLGLVAKGSVWYLVASVGSDIRSYRVSRIVRAEVINERATIPGEFDLPAYWESSSAAFRSSLPNYTATFRIAPDVLPFLRFAGRFARVSDSYETEANGWIRITVGFDVEEMAVGYALSFGPQLEVLEPETLREKVIQEAKKLVESYQSHPQITQITQIK